MPRVAKASGHCKPSTGYAAVAILAWVGGDRRVGGSTTEQSETVTIHGANPDPVSETDATPTVANTDVGTLRGRYVVLEEVGRGGMGRVLRAYDPKLEREVALKVVRTDKLAKENLARLVREARSMAKLSHPNVVAVYDVEVSATGVVLAMEYVAGQTLDQWLQQRPRAWPDVLRCFIAAGRGLVAAHGAGLLHRDFKPTNVLVQHDRDGREMAAGGVKVTDFGLAKTSADPDPDPGLPSPEDTSPTPSAISGDSFSDALTQAGTVIGTPRYMAPEQYRDGSLGPAVDQYAFCVALWEALVGIAPFSSNRSSDDKDQGPPAWPSRTLIPRPIQQAVRRGLEGLPADRWPSMRALLTELEAALPRARVPTSWVLAGLGVAAVGALAVRAWMPGPEQRCGGAVEQMAGVWDSARRAEIESAMLATNIAYAQGEWAHVAPQLDRYAARWSRMYTDTCEATTVRGEQSAAVMDLRMACLRHARSEIIAVTGVLADGDPHVVERAHEVVAGIGSIDRCADVETLSAEVEVAPKHEREAVERGRDHLATAAALRQAGRYSQAQAALEQAQQQLDTVSYGPVQTDLLLERGLLLQRQAQYDTSEAMLERALASAARSKQWTQVRHAAMALMLVVGPNLKRPAEALRYRALADGITGQRRDPGIEARLHQQLAEIYRVQEHHADAEAEARRALALLQSVAAPTHVDVAFSHETLATILNDQAKYEEAEAEHRAAADLLREALGPEHPSLARIQNNLAETLASMGRYDEAEAEFRRALALHERVLGPDHLLAAQTRSNIAGLMLARGRYPEAEAVYRRALDTKRKHMGAEHPDVLGGRNNLALVLSAQGKYTEAEAEYRRMLPIVTKVRGRDHSDVARLHQNLAIALYQQERFADAEAEQRRALATWEAVQEPHHPDIARSRSNLGAILQEQEKFDEAEAEFLGGLQALRQSLGPEHPEVATVEGNLADFHLEREQPALALALAEHAWASPGRADIPQQNQANIAFILARAVWSTGGDPTRARALARQAIELSKDRQTRDDGETGLEAEAWLDDHP